MKTLILACTAVLGLLPEPAYPQRTAVPEGSVPGVRLAIALTNNVLVPGSTTLLKCWITNSSTSGLVLERSPGEGSTGQYRFEVWLSAEGGKEYVLIPGLGGAGSRMAEAISRGEVRSYHVPLPIAADIPSGRYKLRAKRALTTPTRPQLLSNSLDVQVK
jgi:hypothetical protein